MALLLPVAFLVGVITGVSPCVLPVLPIVLAGGAAGGRRRPYAVVAGLVLSFAVFTLFGAWLLRELGLPDDLLRNVGIALLLLVGLVMLVPKLGIYLERPVARIARRPTSDLGGGFLLGVSLGPVFVPCASIVLAAIVTNAARLEFGWRTLLLTIAYSLGLAVPLLAVAVVGQRALERAQRVKRRLALLRPVLGLVILAATVAIIRNVDRDLAKLTPGYTQTAQNALERGQSVRREIEKLTAAASRPQRSTLLDGSGSELGDYGSAPDFRGIAHWLNTPGGRPLSLDDLRGKVVLVDFWTYSCINCLRTLPHLEAWYRTYARDGFVIVGVHTPEFAFEHDLGNVKRATRELGVHYPVALDNDYATWNAYFNRYWPAEYLIDAHGRLRHSHFGEGEYQVTESLIRQLLAERTPKLPAAVHLADRTPAGEQTPETYLGWLRLSPRYSGTPVEEDRFAHYSFPPRLLPDEYAYAGRWRVEGERIVAGPGARLRLFFHAHSVHLVLGGRGSVEVVLDRRLVRRVRVTEDRLYTLVDLGRKDVGLLELRFTPRVAAYAFTFG